MPVSRSKTRSFAGSTDALSWSSTCAEKSELTRARSEQARDRNTLSETVIAEWHHPNCKDRLVTH
jgi:hypothetical protein